MGLARSTFYDLTPVSLAADELVARIGAICDEFEMLRLPAGWGKASKTVANVAYQEDDL